jgi:hypothetical protein
MGDDEERRVRCGECGAVEAESLTTSIPLYREEPLGWIDGWRCRRCRAATAEAMRRRIQLLDADDGADGEHELELLAEFFRARGAPPPLVKGSALKSALVQMIDELAGGLRTLAVPERTLLCSGCIRDFRESQIHVLPAFNDSVEDYVTTFRCQDCFGPTLEQTRARLSVTDDEDPEIGQLAAFFERHVIFIHEHRRGDPGAVVKHILLFMLERMRTGKIVLRIPQTGPVPW